MPAEESYPEDLRYHRDHDWVRVDGDEAVFGITWHAQDALGEVVYFEPPAVGATVAADGSYGSLESVKAVSDVIAPLAGTVTAVNDRVVESPELTLPHPRMATRRFVLEPCAEIAAELPYPLAACTIRDLLDNISAPHPLVAVVGVPGSGAAEVAAAVSDATLARLIRAPAPLGGAVARSGGEMLELATALRRPLLTDGWTDDPHGTVTDYWLDALPAIAVEHVAEHHWPAFASEYERLARDVVTPHVAIFLRLSPAEIRDRLAFRSGPAAIHSDVFADLPTVGPAEREGVAARLEQLQARFERRLRCPSDRCPRAPKAVITIAADDLATAAAEATAAVEAML